MVEYIPQSSCISADGLNQTCACTNEELNNKIAVCAAQSCTIKELLSKHNVLYQDPTDRDTLPATQNASSTACGQPVRDHSADMTVFSLSFGSVAYLSFIVRIASRLTTRAKTMFWDDWTMMLTIVCGYGSSLRGH